MEVILTSLANASGSELGMGALVVTIFLAGIASIWRLANTVRDRPTSTHIDKKFTAVQEDIKDLQIASAKRGVTLQSIEKDVSRLARRHDSQPAVNSQS
jgi:hypothetical protein